MILGAQLYTTRNFTQSLIDLERTLLNIKEIGYTTVQLSAIGGGIQPESIKEICDKLGLKIVLTHSDINRILYDTENLIEEHSIMGCDYIGLGSLPEKYRDPDWFTYFVEDFREPLKKIAAAGKLFMYHNHNFEFEKKNGVRLIEQMVEAFSPSEMGIILDTYWVQAAGADILMWIDLLRDRIPCIHLKDMTVKGMEIRMAPVMEGNMNFPAILDALKNTNAKYLLVEQDNCYSRGVFQCLKTSYNNLSSLGYR